MEGPNGRARPNTDAEGGPELITVSAPTFKQAVYGALRDMIIELELPPGARLVEGDLAARIGVSKTPIREAFSVLEGDGLVEIAPYRGASVTWLTVADMEEQGFLVDTIEVPAYPRIAELATRDELAAVARVVHQLKLARAKHDGRRFRQLTSEYHRLLLTPARYPRLVRLLTSLVFPIGLRVDRVFLDNFDDAWDLQLSILVSRFEAIKRRDPSAAAEAVLAMRNELMQLNMSRLSHPLVAPYVRSDPGK